MNNKIQEIFKMILFKKKCMYCREKIEKGLEEFKEVKVRGYVGTFNKAFCSEKHAEQYEEELNNNPPKKSVGGCCG